MFATTIVHYLVIDCKNHIMIDRVTCVARRGHTPHQIRRGSYWQVSVFHAQMLASLMVKPTLRKNRNAQRPKAPKDVLRMSTIDQNSLWLVGCELVTGWYWINSSEVFSNSPNMTICIRAYAYAKETSSTPHRHNATQLFTLPGKQESLPQRLRGSKRLDMKTSGMGLLLRSPQLLKHTDVNMSHHWKLFSAQAAFWRIISMNPVFLIYSWL